MPLFNRPRVSVTLGEDMAFIHPNIIEDLPSRDPLVTGTVLVSLPSPKAVSTITVELVGLTDVSAGPSWSHESTETINKKLAIDLHGEELPAGKHAFNFSFLLPSNTAPFQRCTYGRTRHSVKATVNWTGAGVFGGTARTTSDPVALFVVANPQPAGELPQPLDISLQHFSNDLGGIGIGFASPYLTVASLVNVRFTLLGAPSNISIKSIESFITQEYALSVHGNTKVVRPPPQTHKLSKIDKLRASQVLSVAICTNDCSAPLPRFDISGRLLEDPLPPRICSHCDEDHNAPVTSPTPPCCPPHGDAELIEHDPYPLVSELKAGTPFNFSRTFRVPNDDYIRGTTMEDTDTRIRVSHKLSVEVRYQVAGEQDDKLFTLSKPVSIASCCCFADSLYLPAYTRSAPKTIVRPLHSRCYCNFSLKEMVDRDGLALQRAGEIDAPTAGARLLGAERLSKSAACSMGLETRSPSFDSRMTSSASSVVSEAGPSTPLDELQGPCLPALKLEASAG